MISLTDFFDSASRRHNDVILLPAIRRVSEARCIKERSSDLRHSCGALLNATPAPAGALQVFLDHKKTSHP